MGNVIKMSEATLPVKRTGKTTAIDAEGRKVRTNSQVKELGVGTGTGAGKPRAFETGDDLLNAFTAFIDYVIDSEFSVYPTKRAFAEWMGIDRKTVYNAVNVYFPQAKKTYTDMLADCLAEGVASGAFPTSFTIFALKNWCNWADKTDNVNTEIKPTLADKETADRLIKEYVDRKK